MQVVMPPAALAQGRAWIRLHRTYCFGFCPVYAVTLYDDGEVLWEGIDNVRVLGPERSRAQPAEVRRILARFAALEPPPQTPRGSWSYSTDLPSVIVEDGTRRVVHDFGADREVLQGIGAFADAIDALAQTHRWVDDACPGLVAESLIFDEGELELEAKDAEVQHFNKQAFEGAVRQARDGGVVRLRVLDSELGRRRAQKLVDALQARGVAPSRITVRVLDPGLKDPANWDVDVVWLDYGLPSCL